MKMMEQLSHKELVAIDLECENNLHHYGAYVTLLQISDGDAIWIVDALNLKGLQPLLGLFTNSAVQKVFHDVNFDLRIISNQWGCRVINVFDTQLAALFLGEEKLGLGSLLEKYFKIKTEKRFQRVDWTKRPLSRDKLVYAARDVAYLLQLKQKLERQLLEKEKLSWLIEECSHLDQQNWIYKEQSYLDLPGVKSLNALQRSIAKALFEARKQLAKKIDKPPFMVFSNQQLLAFAKHPPQNWVMVRKVHPIVAEAAEYLKRLIQEASQKPDIVEKKSKRKLSSHQYQWIRDLLELRTKLGNKVGLKGYLLLNNEQVWDIAATQSLDGLRNWQKELLENQSLILDILRS